ncbi:hypothetical protein Pint_28835 [Pistacia integerrima]|uniref:Uncharacterized protein n=1 Tax=Pistacia integerrima TaxID=434235 RepID=A0ACC0X2J8_9ROSI|nr:hypothetical protein Pint_28835 [Pistacia integerrima]
MSSPKVNLDLEDVQVYWKKASFLDVKTAKESCHCSLTCKNRLNLWLCTKFNASMILKMFSENFEEKGKIDVFKSMLEKWNLFYL